MKNYIVELFDDCDQCWFKHLSFYDYYKALYAYRLTKKSLPNQHIRLIKVMIEDR